MAGSKRHVREVLVGRVGLLFLLVGALEVGKEKQLVTLDGSPKPIPDLVAVERLALGVKAQAGSHILIAVIVEAAAMKLVGPATGDDADGPRGRQRGGKVEGGLGKLEFLDRVGGDVGHRHSYSLVRNINAVELNARAGAASALDLHGKVSRALGGVVDPGVHKLHAWLQLRQTQEVSRVQGHLVNLLGRHVSGNRRRGGIHLYWR